MKHNLNLICLIIFVIICNAFFFNSNSLAIENNTIVINLKTNRTYSFFQIQKKYEQLISNASDKRREFENLYDYQKRINENNKFLYDFIEAPFSLTTPPDRLNFDWPNSQIMVDIFFPYTVLRKRGGGNYESNTLKLIIPVKPNTARVLKTFPDEINVFIIFNFTMNRSLIIDSISIKYHEELIFNEK